MGTCGRRAVLHLQTALLPALSLLLLMVAGCAGLPPQQPPSTQDIVWVLSGAGALSGAGDVPMEDPKALLHVSDAMRQFARQATHLETDVDDKTRALVDALDRADGLHVTYDAEATLTAEQAFQQRRANCLSYTLLFVALAREVGVPAQFSNYDIPPVWGIDSDKTLLLYLHINARVDLGGGNFQIVDVSGDDYDPGYVQEQISDVAAEAQYFNNRSVDLRVQGHYSDSLRYLLRALQLSPDTAFLWSNLANLYLLIGNPHAGRVAIDEALMLDAYSMMSYSTATQVYERLGDSQRASYFRKKSQEFRDLNPYYHYQLALAAVDRHDEPLAYEEVHRALLLDRMEPRFFFLAAVLLKRAGDARLAADCLQEAIDLTQSQEQQQRYRNKFLRLTDQG